MLLIGASATSFDWPVVRNVSGASPALIHVDGSPNAWNAGIWIVGAGGV